MKSKIYGIGLRKPPTFWKRRVMPIVRVSVVSLIIALVIGIGLLSAVGVPAAIIYYLVTH